MEQPDIILEIQTLGRLSISVNGIPLAVHWPDKNIKTFFCSLLSPLDLYFAWDRICRSILGEAETRKSRRTLEKTIVRPLDTFLMKEFGFKLLIEDNEGIRIDRRLIHLDVIDFYSSVMEGLRQLSHGNHIAAHDSFNKAKSLYSGCYLPEEPGKIIANTRKELESIFSTVIVGRTRTNPIPLSRAARYVPEIIRWAA